MSTYAASAPYRKPVAAAIAIVFSLVAPAVLASTWTVDDTCVDDLAGGDLVSRTGTLRFCVANAISGDTIDLSQTTCSQITLTTVPSHAQPGE